MTKRNLTGAAILGVVASGTLLVLSQGCQSKPDAQPRVGAILARSGPADFIGRPEAAMLEALLADYNANGQNPLDIEFLIRDSAGDPNTAVSLLDKFAKDENVVAVIGPSTSGESIPAARRAAEHGIPLLSLGASKRIVVDDAGNTNRWAFKFAQNDSLAADRLVGAMRQQGLERAALLYSDDGFGKSGANEFRRAVGDAGLILTHDTAFPPALDAPEPFVAAVPADAEAVMVWGTAPGPALLVKSLRAAGHPGQILLSHGNASDQFLASAGTAAEGAIVVGSRVLIPTNYLDEADPADAIVLRYRRFWHEKNFDGSPSHFAGHARDAFEAVMTAVSAETLTGDIAAQRRKLRDQLERTSKLFGVTGTFSFNDRDHAGLSMDAFETYRVSNAEFVPLTETK